jgi:hypothetical protein
MYLSYVKKENAIQIIFSVHRICTEVMSSLKKENTTTTTPTTTNSIN